MGMELTKKREVWIDTIRVLASLLVIVSHYAWNFNSEQHMWFRTYVAGLGQLGVVLFFAISGYLVCNSFSKNNKILNFYTNKLIRIFIPYMSTYLLMSVLFILLGIINPKFFGLTPIFKLLYDTSIAEEVLLGLFPIDINILKLLGINFYGFVGEWFIGTLCIMYILSPLLYYSIKMLPALTMLGSLVVSVLIFSVSDNLLMHGFWFSLVRLPEFLMGMYIYIYKNTILKYKKQVLALSIFVMFIFLMNIFKYDDMIFINRWLPLKPRSFIVSLPLILLCFIGIERINYKLNLYWFNGYSNISYVFMLIQHIVINTFVRFLDIEKFSKFCVAFVLVLICLVTIYLSQQIQSIYKPFEKYLINKL